MGCQCDSLGIGKLKKGYPPPTTEIHTMVRFRASPAFGLRVLGSDGARSSKTSWSSDGRTGNTGFGECEEEGNKCASLDDSQKVSEKMDKIIALAGH